MGTLTLLLSSTKHIPWMPSHRVFSWDADISLHAVISVVAEAAKFTDFCPKVWMLIGPVAETTGKQGGTLGWFHFLLPSRDIHSLPQICSNGLIIRRIMERMWLSVTFWIPAPWIGLAFILTLNINYSIQRLGLNLYQRWTGPDSMT